MTNSKLTTDHATLWGALLLALPAILGCFVLFLDVNRQQQLHREQVKDLRNAVYGDRYTNSLWKEEKQHWHWRETPINQTMTEQEQIVHLADDLDRLVERYRKEYSLTYASVIGALMMKVHLLCMEDTQMVGDDDEDGKFSVPGEDQ